MATLWTTTARPRQTLDSMGLPPVFQAPVGSITSPELVAAVSNAGGVGHLASTWCSPLQVEQDLARVRQLTDKPFGVNFVLDFPVEEQLDAAIRCGAPIVSFFWGDGSKYLDRLKAADIVAIQVIGSVDEARTAASAGFDIIVAQGCEAGGHVRGRMSTLTLVPQVVDAVGEVAVLAAGGIADQRGVSAAYALGAVGVWVGTRFLAAAEANIHPIYQNVVLAADQSVYTELFNVGWDDAPMRVIPNSTYGAWCAAGQPQPPNRPGEGEPVAQRANGDSIVRYQSSAPTRTMTGEIEAMALYAGDGVGLVRSVEPAAAIVAELMRGWPGRKQ